MQSVRDGVRHFLPVTGRFFAILAVYQGENRLQEAKPRQKIEISQWLDCRKTALPVNVHNRGWIFA